jgi:hypothetical protein
MTAYTWTMAYATKVRTYQDPAREIRAAITPLGGGWSWAVTQWGRPLEVGHTRLLADARTAAEQWITTLTEVTPV